MSDTLKRAVKLASGITPGEWETYYTGNGDCMVRVAEVDYVLADVYEEDRETQLANARFTAAAPSLVRELVAEVKALREERGKAITILGSDPEKIQNLESFARGYKRVNDYLHSELTSLREVVEKVREYCTTVRPPVNFHPELYSEDGVRTLLDDVLSRLPEVPK